MALPYGRGSLNQARDEELGAARVSKRH